MVRERSPVQIRSRAPIEYGVSKCGVLGKNSLNKFWIFMAKNRITTHLVCSECKERNYTQVVGKGRTIGTLKLKKFCSRCRKHHEHKETK